MFFVFVQRELQNGIATRGNFLRKNYVRKPSYQFARHHTPHEHVPDKAPLLYDRLLPSLIRTASNGSMGGINKHKKQTSEYLMRKFPYCVFSFSGSVAVVVYRYNIGTDEKFQMQSGRSRVSGKVCQPVTKSMSTHITVPLVMRWMSFSFELKGGKRVTCGNVSIQMINVRKKLLHDLFVWVSCACICLM